MMRVLMATIVVGYIVCAAAFYVLAARTAMAVEDQTTTMPSKVQLSIVEGGSSEPSDLRHAA